EPDIIFTTKMLLEGEGYEVVVARSGEECLDRVKEEKPDLILLDVMMPALDGWEVSKRIKEDKETRDIPIAMLTVRTSENSREKSLTYAKADAQIDKPFNIKVLLEMVKDLLG
ncbi:MAG: PleD family two-component system response regulator, partial [Candidatus Hydrothermarchaeales archaeon]